MRVILAIDFEDVDADSEQADQIIQEIGQSCETMRVGLNASSCFVHDVEQDYGRV
jgi:hypothetical protein